MKPAFAPEAGENSCYLCQYSEIGQLGSLQMCDLGNEKREDGAPPPKQTDAPKGIKIDLAHLPSDIYGLAGLIAICLTILIAVGMSLFLTPPGGKTEIGVSELHVAAFGSSILNPERTNTRLLEFWTPSEDTRIWLCGIGPDKVEALDQVEKEACTGPCESHKELLMQDKWECSVSKAEVLKFEEELWKTFHCKGTDPCNPEIRVGPLSGLHRYREEGIGYRGLRKAGWWWEINVEKDFDLKDFADFYVSQWCKGRKSDLVEECKIKPVYVEEISGSGGYKTGP